MLVTGCLQTDDPEAFLTEASARICKPRRFCSERYSLPDGTDVARGGDCRETVEASFARCPEICEVFDTEAAVECLRELRQASRGCELDAIVWSPCGRVFHDCAAPPGAPRRTVPADDPKPATDLHAPSPFLDGPCRLGDPPGECSVAADRPAPVWLVLFGLMAVRRRGRSTLRA